MRRSKEPNRDAGYSIEALAALGHVIHDCSEAGAPKVHMMHRMRPNCMSLRNHALHNLRMALGLLADEKERRAHRALTQYI